MRFREGIRGQVSIFVIVALIIVAGLVLFFVVRNQTDLSGIPGEFLPVYEFYEQCIAEESFGAVRLAGLQGGVIDAGDYLPGSEFAPFGSHLNFLNTPIKYWFGISANGVIEKNIPSKDDIEGEIGNYLEDRILGCDFQRFYEQGLYIDLGEGEVEVDIRDDKVLINVFSEVVVSDGNDIGIKDEFSIEIDSKFGELYSDAREVYDEQVENAFLEDYAVDVLRLYAPVDGVDVECSPSIWKTNEIISEVQKGLEGNIGNLRGKGNYYSLSDDKEEYFVVPLGTGEPVRFRYSENWPIKVEITGEGVDDELIVAEPVGTQEGLGVLGFCYVPYHYVYDLSFPVLVQLGDGTEIFQFPVVVIVDNNLPREGIYSGTAEDSFGNEDFCRFKTQDVRVNVFDENLNRIDGADINYVCFDQSCRLGKADQGIFVGKTPSCLNGRLVVGADGFADSSVLYSSNNQETADVVLEREYSVDLELEVGGRALTEGETGIISFNGDRVETAAFPDVKDVSLTEGFYNISVYVYGNSAVKIPESTKRTCTEVAKGGVSGFFGATEEQCFDITLPETEIEFALIGGGVSEHFLLGDQLKSGRLKIKVDEMESPESLDQLQENYQTFNIRGVEIEA